MNKIDTLQGTMEAKAWHIGKHVAAYPNSYNWRLMDEDIDDVIRVLETPGAACAVGGIYITSYITVTHRQDGSVAIEARDTTSKASTKTVLSDAGRLQFLDILRSVAHLPNDVRENARREHNEWLLQRDNDSE